MELKDKLQNLSKHSEYRWTLPFLVWRCFHAEYSINGRCAGYRRVLGSIPGAPLCDVSIQAAQLRSVLGVHTGLTLQWYQNADIRRSAKQTKIDSAIYI